MRKILLFAFLAMAFAPFLRAQAFDLNADRQPVISLDGPWRFHPGDNPAWAGAGFDDSQWPLIRSDEGWAKQGYAGLSGFAWYRFKLQLPDDSQPESLLLSGIMTSYRVYADGQLIGAYGYLPPHHLSMHALPQVFDLPPASRHNPRVVQIAIRVWQDPIWAYYTPGGAFTPGNLAGNRILIHSRLKLMELAIIHGAVNLYAYSILAALFGLLAFGLFLMNRSDHEFLWFALVLLALAAESAARVAFLSLPVEIYDLIVSLMIGLFSVAALLFFRRVLRARRGFWWWLAIGTAPLVSVTIFSYWYGLTSVPVSNAFGILCLLPSQLWIVVVLVRGAVRKDPDSRLLLFPAFLMFGYNIANDLTGTAYQLGWQRFGLQVNPILLDHPFPLSLLDLVDTVFAFFMVAFLIRRFSLARKEEQRLAGEFEAARTTQSLLIPAVAPATPGFTVESVYLPAQEVGGDFFQVLPGDNGSLLLVVGDVSGKGLRAAMTVSTLVGALRGCPFRQPAKVLAHLNLVLAGQVSGFVTCCAILITHDGAAVIANAGHLAPYRNGEEVLVDNGLPLGIAPDATYPETTLQLAPNDRLTFLSDGVVEAQSESGELFGFDRTRLISTQSAEVIAAAAQQFGQEDDITVLTLNFVPSEVMP